MLRPAKPEEIPKPEKPDFIADWLDANVWDGENVSISEFYNSLHKAHFSPRSLYELFTECFEFAIEKTKELEND